MGHVARIRERKNTYRVLVRKSETKSYKIKKDKMDRPCITDMRKKEYIQSFGVEV